MTRYTLDVPPGSGLEGWALAKAQEWQSQGVTAPRWHSSGSLWFELERGREHWSAAVWGTPEHVRVRVTLEAMVQV